MNATLSTILRDRLIAVVRTDTPESLTEVTHALVEGGITVIEVTLTIPDAIEAIRNLVMHFSQRALIGAGTVTTQSDARECVKAGAKFVVSPIVSLEVIQLAKSMNTIVMAGAYTPTEIHQAWSLGADIVKLFPADSLGPNYLKAVRGPMPEIRLMPTGGVDLTTIPAYLKAGACCLGVGGSLIDKAAIANRDWGKLTALARQYRSIVPPLATLSWE